MEAALRKPGVVYLYQFPRCTRSPSPSPYCWKVETFLRMAKIDYIVTGSYTMGPKGKLPFIELDGETVADSDFIIEFLIKRFNLTDHLDERQKAVAHAMEQMLEENTIMALPHHHARVRHMQDMPYMLETNPGFFFYWMVRLKVGKTLEAVLNAQGLGRHSIAEVATIVGKDLGALSALLGSSQYVMGDTMTSYDAGVFGMMASLYYLIPDSEPRRLMDGKYSNIGDYVKRLRAELYPDWDELLCKG